MIVGVPKEINVHESRVAITPEGVSEFVHAGHTVLIEDKAGVGSSISNEEFVAAGATIVATADDFQKNHNMTKEESFRAATRVHAGVNIGDSGPLNILGRAFGFFKIISTNSYPSSVGY